MPRPACKRSGDVARLGASKKALVEQFGLVGVRRDGPRHVDSVGEHAVGVAADRRRFPARVLVHNHDVVPLARRELDGDALLESFSLRLQRRDHQTAADEVARIADSFRGAQAVKIRLVGFDVQVVERVKSEPNRN